MDYTIDQKKKQVFLLVKKGLTKGLTEEETKLYDRLVKELNEKA